MKNGGKGRGKSNRHCVICSRNTVCSLRCGCGERGKSGCFERTWDPHSRGGLDILRLLLLRLLLLLLWLLLQLALRRLVFVSLQQVSQLLPGPLRRGSRSRSGGGSGGGGGGGGGGRGVGRERG